MLGIFVCINYVDGHVIIDVSMYCSVIVYVNYNKHTETGNLLMINEIK